MLSFEQGTYRWFGTIEDYFKKDTFQSITRCVIFLGLKRKWGYETLKQKFRLMNLKDSSFL
jgi:hypothetical protein